MQELVSEIHIQSLTHTHTRNTTFTKMDSVLHWPQNKVLKNSKKPWSKPMRGYIVSMEMRQTLRNNFEELWFCDEPSVFYNHGLMLLWHLYPIAVIPLNLTNNHHHMFIMNDTLNMKCESQFWLSYEKIWSKNKK